MKNSNLVKTRKEGQVLDSGCNYFIDLCRKLFQLEEKYDYTAQKPSRHHTECIWKLNREDCEILMMVENVESYGIPTIKFYPPNRNEVFGLHEAVPSLDPDHDASKPEDVSYSMNRKQLKALLEHWSVFFHKYAAELLEDQSKTFAKVENFRKINPDPYP
jgi:hypothetical protein